MKSKILSNEVISSGFLKVCKLTLEVPKIGGVTTFIQVREVAHQNDSVFILPYDPDTNKCVIVSQHRPCSSMTDEDTLIHEPIAGRIDKVKSPQEIACMELQEEAGINASEQDLIFVGCGYSSPGSSTEKCYLYLMPTNLNDFKEGNFGLQEEGEDVLASIIDLNSVFSMESVSVQLLTLASYAMYQQSN